MMRLLKWLGILLIAVAVLLAAAYAAFQVSPWPSVLLIRHGFDQDSAARNAALAKHVPPGIAAIRDRRYGDGGSAFLDVYYPEAAVAGGATLPAVVWIHGGAFIAGQRADVGEYLKILAAKGYVAIAIGYPLAPSVRYPEPVRAANAALAYVAANAAALHVDPQRLFLAGDSAGAQIAGQLAAAIADPAYASTVGLTPAVVRAALRGVVLFCGVFDAASMDFSGSFGSFLRTVTWSYFGAWDAAGDPRLAEFAVARHVSAAFPPAFVSVGNADPLAPQSVALAEAIGAAGVPVDTLFFPAGHEPPLRHEYQFDLDSEAGQLAFDRLIAFLGAND